MCYNWHIIVIWNHETIWKKNLCKIQPVPEMTWSRFPSYQNCCIVFTRFKDTFIESLQQQDKLMFSIAKCVDFSHTLRISLHKKMYEALKWFESTYQSVLSRHVTLRACCEYFVTFECVSIRDIWGNKNICHVIIRKRCSNPTDIFLFLYKQRYLVNLLPFCRLYSIEILGFF